jgi:hypothetical protein
MEIATVTICMPARWVTLGAGFAGLSKNSAMSANRVVSKQTEEFFQASETGDVQAVKDLVQDPHVDINWHCTQSVRCCLVFVRGDRSTENGPFCLAVRGHTAACRHRQWP